MSYIAERRQEERERRRAEILDAAEAVGAEVGWDALTMEQVARRARLSRALLYVYFKDKKELMFGVSERGLALLAERFRQAVARGRTGLEQMVGIGRAYMAFAQEFPVHFDTMARCELQPGELAELTPSEQACLASGHSVQALMVGVLQAGIADGSVRADLGDPKLVANVLWGFTHGVIQLVATKGQFLAADGVDARQLMDQALTMATHALEARR